MSKLRLSASPLTGAHHGNTEADGKDEPQVSVPATCSICGRKTDEGIEINHEQKTIGFCVNRHYVQWWKTIHQDESLNTEEFEAPENRYKEKLSRTRQSARTQPDKGAQRRCLPAATASNAEPAIPNDAPRHSLASDTARRIALLRFCQTGEHSRL